MPRRQLSTFGRRQAAIMLSVFALAACDVQRAPAAPPYPAVPAIKSEVIPAPPVHGEGLIWQPGHWEWSGADYTWLAGDWVQRGEHSNNWQDGFWSQVGGKWVWVAGHWV